jgi:hypothetical protein
LVGISKEYIKQGLLYKDAKTARPREIEGDKCCFLQNHLLHEYLQNKHQG